MAIQRLLDKDTEQGHFDLVQMTASLALHETAYLQLSRKPPGYLFSFPIFTIFLLIFRRRQRPMLPSSLLWNTNQSPTNLGPINNLTLGGSRGTSPFLLPRIIGAS